MRIKSVKFRIPWRMFLSAILILLSSEAVAQTHKIDSLKRELSKAGSDTNKVKLLIRLSNLSLKTDIHESSRFAEEAVALSRKLHYENGEGDALVRVGIAASDGGDYETAQDRYEEALAIFKKLNNPLKVGRILNNIGLVNMNMGNYKEAIEFYLKSLDLKKKEKDSSGMASCYTNIAIVFALKSDYDQAQQYFENAVDIYRHIHDSANLCKNLLNLGGLYANQGKYDASIELIHSLQRYYRENKIQGELARTFYILGSNYEALNQYESALKQYEEALAIYIATSNKMQECGSRLKLASIYNKTNRHKQALVQGEEALKLALELKAKGLIFDAYKLLAEIHYALKNYQTAYEYRLKYESVKDSVLNEENSNKIVELEAKYQNKIKKQEIASLREVNRLNNLRLERKKFENYLLAGILVFISIIALLIYNQYRLNKRSNEALKSMNQVIQNSLEEKEVLLREIHHRVKNNLQFVWSLLNLQSRHVKDEETLKTLAEGKNRIKTMALIHQKLYMTENLTGIDMVQYVSGLISNLAETYIKDENHIQLNSEIEPIVLDIDSAMPLGLIMNEIITNALKYAFDDKEQGVIRIRLKKEGELLALNIDDNGRGFPADFDPKTSDTFGLKLVNSLATQLKGDIAVTSDHGVHFSMKIHKFKLA